MTFTHDAYTVAWICALPLELAAAKAMLDEVHPVLTQPRSDHNIYTLGSVSGHNVVVVCLPAGVYGTTSATAAVSHLTSTYQNVRFGLMVGIGGGVPRDKPDIRLGDIVVSKPTNTLSGVIQYDYGKTLHKGQFHRTGSLNKPPPLLLKAIAQMESDYMLGKASLSNIMGSNLQKEEVRKEFPRPSQDLLFQSTYSHAGVEPNCSACDQTQLVDRPERTIKEPHIHYGLIASGNQVMKDARTRDSIAQDLDILCFEMEAAGLMDEIPSLVIRGICDYCDSHKHKEWQGYAAFVAAAYAKALLTLVPLHEKEQINNTCHWMVPFRKNLGFVGREEEITKIEGLIKQINGPSRIAICGLGGVGKTQIALELACRMREGDSRRSIFWIPCTSYATLEQAYMSIAQLVGIQGVKPAEAKDQVKTYLSQQRTGNWLLIFDNADDIDMWSEGTAAATELTEFLPQSEEGRILFTTRNRKLAVKLASPFVIDVSEPDVETGMKILEKALVRKDLLEDRDTTITLLEQLVFLPLAIIQAAAYINANDIALSDYTALLQEQEPDVIELLSEDFDDNGRYKQIQNPVATTWLISYQQIQQLSPLAADYLSFMACISPRDIPQSLLPPAVSKKKKTDALGSLKAFSFISEQIQDHTLSLHRLVHLSTRNWLRQQQQFHLHIKRTADQLAQVFPDDEHTNQKLWRSYMPHALSLIREREFQKEQGSYISLVRNIGRCLRTDGRYNEAALLFETLVSIQRNGTGDPDIPALSSMADLAETYYGQGRWKEAEELEVQVQETCIRVLGPEHPDTLSSMTTLACIYGDQGRWKEAEELDVQVQEIRNRVLGPEHPHTLLSMANLACTYRVQGRWKEAEKLEVQVQEIRNRVLGPEHPDTLSSMANLSQTYWNQGRWKEAEELEVQILEIRNRVLGPEHPNTLSSMTTLACVYRDQGRWKEAEELEVQIQEICIRVLGPEHPDTLLTMANLACTYRDQGQWKKAEELEIQVQEIRNRVLGPEHPDTLLTMANLACTYREQGRWEEAEELEIQVQEICIRVLGPEHPDTLSSMANLACTYREQKRWKEAEGLEIPVKEICNRVLGPEHPDTLSSMANLACTYRDQGRWKEAEGLEVQVQEICNRVLGSEHPHTLLSMANLARTYRVQGRWEEAEELEVQVQEIRTRVLGPEHPQTLSSMANLAYTWYLQQKIHNALNLLEKCVELRNRVLGPSHPNTKSSSHSLRNWKEKLNLLADKRSQAPVQAEIAQPLEENQEGFSPSVVVTNPPDKKSECNVLQHSQGRTTTPIKLLLECHPLFTAFRSNPAALPGPDLQEID
ncbi:hypothetical protein BDV12DRAFT_200486 [Aspergillus spectabilis]